MKFKTVIILTAIAMLCAVWSLETSDKPKVAKFEKGVSYIHQGPPCIQLYDYLVTYSNQYNIPFEIALGVATSETGYRGPFHWKYNPQQTSYAYAYGAMQVQVPTAGFVWGEPVSKERLLTDMRFNVETSMKYLDYLYNRYGQWNTTLGYYNSGYPIVNEYAMAIMRKYNN